MWYRINCSISLGMGLLKVGHIFILFTLIKILLAVSKLFESSRLKDIRAHNLCSNLKGWAGEVEGKADG